MFGVPDRVLDDGSGGEILVYEKFTQTTTSTANSATYGGSNTNGAVVGGGAGIIGNVHSQNAQVTAGAATTNTTTTKTFLNLFINSDGEVYDFKASDSGETYSVSNTSTRCFSKLYTWTSVGASCLLIWPALITVPWAIIAQRKAKQNDQVCP